MKIIRTAKQATYLLLMLLFYCSLINATDETMPGDSASSQHKWINSAPLVLSLSSDGDYAISSHLNGEVVLWDIKQQQAKVIAKHANIYSAYFIKHTSYLMWQDDQTNIVHIQDVDGKAIKQFQVDYPTYGQVITSDLKNYFASDEDWNLYKGYGKNQQLIKSACDYKGMDWGKLLNLTLSNDDHYLLTSGISYLDKKYSIPESITANKACIQRANDPNRPKAHRLYRSPLDAVVLWDVQNGKPLYNFTKNSVKTFATFSPKGNAVLAGDENSLSFLWESNTGKLLVDYCSVYGCLKETNNKPKLDKSGIPTPPKDYFSPYSRSVNIISQKFITDTQYIRFNYYVPYATLYDQLNNKPLAYLPLGKNPMPDVTSYLYDENIDTAPAAHRLVMGQAGHGSGIIVYQYDPDKQTLTKVWAPEGPKVYQGFKGWVQRQYDRLKGDWRWESA